jgi:two-component system OmpR family sensor kinase
VNRLRQAWGASRLVLRIYLVMLLAIAAVIAVIVFGRSRREPQPFPNSTAKFVAETVARQRHDPAALRAELDRARRDTAFDVTIYDGDGRAAGRLLGSASPNPPPPLPPDQLDARLWQGPPPPGAGPLPVPGGHGGPRRWQSGGPHGEAVIRLSGGNGTYAILRSERPRPPGPAADIGLVLLSLGVASLVLAHMIARPLQRIAEAAQRFGKGDLTVRAGLDRQDEFGALSRTFDEMADRVTHLVRAQRELLASVSHELRTPLSRIRVALDLANEGDAEAARESLRDIAEDLGELEELVNDVLAMARFEAQSGGAQAIPRLRTQLIEGKALVKKAAARFSTAHPERTLELVIDGEMGDAGAMADAMKESAAPPIIVDADPNLLRRVLENLLENSHKYSRPETPIQVFLKRRGDQAVFSVVDLGQGIGALDLPHVFEPFFRADRSRTRGTGGVGLGLALSKRVVEAHGGQITIRSEPDRGTSVTFTIPLAADARQPPGNIS